jgi:hypothetical protein
MEQIMTAALDLEGELRRLRLPDGRFITPEPAPHHKPDRHKPLAAALAEALAEPPDPEHAAEAARHLIDCFPGCRVGKAAYAEGLADVVADENIPPAVVRFVCRRARAEAKSLPPLAEMRDRMLAEQRARQSLLYTLQDFPRQLAEAERRDIQEAQAIAAAAARHGATLAPSDLVDAWSAITVGWLHQRINLWAMRAGESFEDADCLMETLAIGRPREAFEAAAALVPALASYCRAREAAIPTAPAHGTPESAVWDRMWPMPEAKFADRIGPIVAAFRQAHRL